jgi:hypothetical protein
MNCDEAELALENQALGILTQADRQSLEDHLLTCEACRAIRPLDLKIQAALGALEDEATRDVDWARLERLTRNWRSDYRGRWWVGLLVTAGQAPLATLAFTRRGWGEWLLLLVLAALVTAWVVRAQIDRRWTAAAQLADSRESLRAFWQRLATVEANGLRRLSWLLPAWAVLWTTLGTLADAGIEASSLTSWVCRGLLIAECFGASLYWRRHAVPRIEALRDDLR